MSLYCTFLHISAHWLWHPVSDVGAGGSIRTRSLICFPRRSASLQCLHFRSFLFISFLFFAELSLFFGICAFFLLILRFSAFLT